MNISSKSILSGKYDLIRQLGSGSYGDVYLGIDSTSHEEVAVKLDNGDSHSTAANEGKILKFLTGVPGVPACHWSGLDRGRYVIVLDLLGENLESLMMRCGGKLTGKTVWEVGRQMLKVLEDIHTKDIIHRDIKPENLAPGLHKKSGTIYLLDFGLARHFRDQLSHQHLFYKEGKGLTGTARFASINSHMGIELSRRDDLESLCYVLIYLLKGHLPWQSLRMMTKETPYDAIFRIKMQTKVQDVCAGVADEMCAMLQYCRGLRFDDKPNYEYIGSLITRMTEAIGGVATFDWVAVKQRKYHVKSKRSPYRSGRLRRVSEVIDERRMSCFLKKKSISEAHSVHRNDSDTTCVNIACRPIITEELRIKAEGLNAHSSVKETQGVCAVF